MNKITTGIRKSEHTLREVLSGFKNMALLLVEFGLFMYGLVMIVVRFVK